MIAEGNGANRRTFIRKPFDEETLFRAAYTYEQSTDWHRRRPPIQQ